MDYYVPQIIYWICRAYHNKFVATTAIKKLGKKIFLEKFVKMNPNLCS